MEKTWTDVLFYFLPSALILGGMYLTIKKFIDRDRQIRMLEIKTSMHKNSLPLKLQAIERMVLFLERISPDTLLPRIHRGGISSGQLHSDLLATIRSEYEHNLTQQVYLSNEVWGEVKRAKEELLKIINMAASETGQQATGVHLSSKIFDIMIKDENYPHLAAVEALKREARELIG
ncbi:MAG: hypothetical protein ABI763_05265 [Bacteroidota bacterium]